jgi:hypothetical protein
LSVIKDSGDRTTYSTGAVRDMHAGKGRFDLMPIDVMAHQLKDDVLSDLAAFQNNPGDYGYLFQALHRFSKLAFESEETMLLETAIHFEQGALKYSPGNWKKGIPVDSYIDSAVRHYLKWRRGDVDERHDRAFVWNVMCCIWTIWHIKEDGNDKN